MAIHGNCAFCYQSDCCHVVLLGTSRGGMTASFMSMIIVHIYLCVEMHCCLQLSQHLTPGCTGLQAQLKRSHTSLNRNARLSRQDVGQAASAVRDLLRAIATPSAGDISECFNCCISALLKQWVHQLLHCCTSESIDSCTPARLEAMLSANLASCRRLCIAGTLLLRPYMHAMWHGTVSCSINVQT